MSEVYLLEPSGVGALVNFQESDAPPASADVPRELREAEVLRPGTYTDMAGQRVTFTVDDLHEYARNYDPADPPPIQLDHSKSARDTQGYVRALRVAGDRLLALTEFLGTYAVEQVRAGLWRKLSGGMYLNPKRMKELTVTPFPAVGTARLLPLDFLDREGGFLASLPVSILVSIPRSRTGPNGGMWRKPMPPA